MILRDPVLFKIVSGIALVWILALTVMYDHSALFEEATLAFMAFMIVPLLEVERSTRKGE